MNKLLLAFLLLALTNEAYALKRPWYLEIDGQSLSQEESQSLVTSIPHQPMAAFQIIKICTSNNCREIPKYNLKRQSATFIQSKWTSSGLENQNDNDKEAV